MPTDTYSRVVLTVIAACLLWLCAMRTGWTVQAQQTLGLSNAPPQPVIIVGWGTVDAQGRVNVTMRGERPGGTSDPTIPVSLVGDIRLEYSDGNPLPVSLTQIKPTGEWEPIRSSVEEEPVRARPGRRDKQ